MHDATGPMDKLRTEELLRTLDGCEGCAARIVAVTESHAMTVIRIDKQESTPITIMCGDCSRLESDMRWTIGRFRYQVLSTAPYRYKLFDIDARFSVECGVVRVAAAPDEWKKIDGPA